MRVCVLAARGWPPALPSMMEMCTALLRVRGTLLRRGPCVMEGQLRLGTSPALGTKTGMVSEPRTVPEPVGSLCHPREIPAPPLGSYRWISGGSRLILALDSITSFATRPLRGVEKSSCEHCTIKLPPRHLHPSTAQDAPTHMGWGLYPQLQGKWEDLLEIQVMGRAGTAGLTPRPPCFAASPGVRCWTRWSHLPLLGDTPWEPGPSCTPYSWGCTWGLSSRRDTRWQVQGHGGATPPGI